VRFKCMTIRHTKVKRRHKCGKCRRVMYMHDDQVEFKYNNSWEIKVCSTCARDIADFTAGGVR